VIVCHGSSSAYGLVASDCPQPGLAKTWGGNNAFAQALAIAKRKGVALSASNCIAYNKGRYYGATDSRVLQGEFDLVVRPHLRSGVLNIVVNYGGVGSDLRAAASPATVITRAQQYCTLVRNAGAKFLLMLHQDASAANQSQFDTDRFTVRDLALALGAGPTSSLCDALGSVTDEPHIGPVGARNDATLIEQSGHLHLTDLGHSYAGAVMGAALTAVLNS
jgi:hypothetical protein